MGGSMQFRRGLVVEDFDEAAAWLSQALREAFPGIGVSVASSLAQGREILRASRPEVALIDLGLPDGSGIDLVVEARMRSPAVPVIVTSLFSDDDHIFPALRAGASGYLLKEESRETLVGQIQAMTRGELPLSPTIAQQVMRYFSGLRSEAQQVEHLTDKEREVLKHIAGGATLNEVAARLGVTRNTVHTHVKHVYDKLGVSTRAEATAIAARLGIFNI